MKSLFCWFIKSALPILGPMGLCTVLVPGEYFDDEGKTMIGILGFALQIVLAYATAKFTADNYEEYFMGYYDWLASRVSFFETKTGFVIRTFLWSACFYSFPVIIILGAIFGLPKVG